MPGCLSGLGPCVSATFFSPSSSLCEGDNWLFERASEPLLCSPLLKSSDREAVGPHVRRSVQAGLERTKFVGQSEDEADGDQQGSGSKREQPVYAPIPLAYHSLAPVQCLFFWANLLAF